MPPNPLCCKGFEGIRFSSYVICFFLILGRFILFVGRFVGKHFASATTMHQKIHKNSKAVFLPQGEIRPRLSQTGVRRETPAVQGGAGRYQVRQSEAEDRQYSNE